MPPIVPAGPPDMSQKLGVLVPLPWWAAPWVLLTHHKFALAESVGIAPQAFPKSSATRVAAYSGRPVKPASLLRCSVFLPRPPLPVPRGEPWAFHL